MKQRRLQTDTAALAQSTGSRIPKNATAEILIERTGKRRERKQREGNERIPPIRSRNMPQTVVFPIANAHVVTKFRDYRTLRHREVNC